MSGQNYDGWEVLRDESNPEKERILGKGGQGTVFLARSPDTSKRRRQSNDRARGLLSQVIGGRYEADELASCLRVLASPDPPENLGALKRFEIQTEGDAKKAVGRLEAEIKALENAKHIPSVLKLLHSNLDQRFIVTQYHPCGTLAHNLGRYKGDVLAALQAFRPLVDGVREIHKANAIHRDIKPENIFLSLGGDLVLGDFGIVFFRELGNGRLTATVGERVGSHEWMAPWAYERTRLDFDELGPPLDLYPLGKVLWSMISGRNGFSFWELDDPKNDLTKIIPDDPTMGLVNGLLAKVVVRNEKDCRLSSAAELLSEVDALIARIRAIRGYKPDRAETWPCRVCGKGNYQGAGRPYLLGGFPQGAIQAPNVQVCLYLCDHCGHAELFSSEKRAF